MEKTPNSYFASVPDPVQQPVYTDYFAPPPPPPVHESHVNPGASVPGAVIVIGQQFCSPVPLDFICFKKSLYEGEYNVTDASGRTFFRSEARLGLHEKRVLLDKNGNNLLFLKAKGMTLHDTWFVYTGIKAKEENKLLTVKKSSAFQLKTGLDVFLASNMELKTPDFRVEGKYMAREYTVYQKDKVLASGKRKRDAAHYLRGASAYDVHIEAAVDSAFIIALMLIVRVEELHTIQTLSPASTAAIAGASAAAGASAGAAIGAAF